MGESTSGQAESARGFAWVSLIAGACYPAFWLIAPAGAIDPHWVWWLVAASYVVCASLALLGIGFRPMIWLALPQFLSTLQLHVLFALNPREPFYAAAGLLQIFSSLLFLQNLAPVFAYAWFALALSAVPMLAGGGVDVSFYACGVASLIFLANRSFRSALRERERARAELQDANTELAHEKAERIRLQEELLVSQRMDSLGRLAGAFSHEFNNQLMAIRIHAELLENSLPAGAPQRGDLDQIQATTSAAADLTARLLSFSRPTRGSEEAADLAAVVRTSLVTLRHLMTETTPVAWGVPESTCKVPVGAKQLNQILLNLALNARDAMPLGGTLRIDVSRKARGSVELPIDIRCQTLVVLTVSDSGTGIAPDVRDRIFEPFFTTKAERGNTGLGLSIVYGIVKETGGHIRVTSEPGKGTRFDLFWPEHVASAADAPAIAPAIADAEPHRARVLLVEDQAVLRDGLTRWLGARGFAVVSCESGEEALARANGVDVIASDVVLRGMDGIELLGRLRRRTPLLPAVLFSGHLDHLAAQRRKIPDGVMFLEKPFAPEALATTIDSLVEATRDGSIPTAH